jgi:hypothetical protein
MSWIAKTRPGAHPQTSLNSGSSSSNLAPRGPVSASKGIRVSNGLKDFLWTLGDINHVRLLDLGQIANSTLTFLIEHGFRVSTEDLLRSWKDFLDEKVEAHQRNPLEDEDALDPKALANQFLETALVYPKESFNAILAWDLLDYIDAELMTRVVARLFDLLQPGGAVLALFHSRTPEQFCRYRIVEDQSLELLPTTPAPATHQRIFQNRAIMDLFTHFYSSKTYVGRDQLREGLFIK